MSNRGVLFTATGKDAFCEDLVSARRVREPMPGLPVAIASDRDHGNDGIFSHIEVLPEPLMSCGDKIEGMARSPFEETLFLDPDTYVAEDPSSAFDLLERYTIAVSHAPYRNPLSLDGVPASFPELNTGVVFFRRGTEWNEFQTKWKCEYKTLEHKNDQPSFRKVLWESGTPFSVLPTEFQFRTATHCFAGEGESVRISDGRHCNIKRLAVDLNRTTHARVYVKSFRKLWADEVITESRLHGLIKKVLRPFL